MTTEYHEKCFKRLEDAEKQLQAVEAAKEAAKADKATLEEISKDDNRDAIKALDAELADISTKRRPAARAELIKSVNAATYAAQSIEELDSVRQVSAAWCISQVHIKTRTANMVGLTHVNAKLKSRKARSAKKAGVA